MSEQVKRYRLTSDSSYPHDGAPSIMAESKHGEYVLYSDYQTLLSRNAALEREVKELREALTSGLCSKHQIPEPLTCDVCSKVKWLQAINEDQLETIYALRTTLKEPKR